MTGARNSGKGMFVVVYVYSVYLNPISKVHVVFEVKRTTQELHRKPDLGMRVRALFGFIGAYSGLLLGSPFDLVSRVSRVGSEDYNRLF